MVFGPIELIVIQFPDNQFKGNIIPALKALVEQETIRIIDVLLVSKDQQGQVTTHEISELTDDEYSAFDPLVDEIRGLLTTDDAQQVAAKLDKNSSAGMMLFENRWAKEFQDAVLEAKGRLVLSERVPAAVIDELLSAQQPA